MKLPIIIYLLVAAVFGFSSCSTTQDQYALVNRKPGTPFAGTGTVTTHSPHICASGAINYDLHAAATAPAMGLSAHHSPKGKVTDKLSLLLLRQAAHDPKKVVHVEGVMAAGPEKDCLYVTVIRVTPENR